MQENFKNITSNYDLKVYKIGDSNISINIYKDGHDGVYTVNVAEIAQNEEQKALFFFQL